MPRGRTGTVTTSDRGKVPALRRSVGTLHRGRDKPCHDNG